MSCHSFFFYSSQSNRGSPIKVHSTPALRSQCALLRRTRGRMVCIILTRLSCFSAQHTSCAPISPFPVPLVPLVQSLQMTSPTMSSRPIAQTNPAKLMSTNTRHMIAPLRLRDRPAAPRTRRTRSLHQPSRRRILSPSHGFAFRHFSLACWTPSINAILILGTHLAFMPIHTMSRAKPMSTRIAHKYHSISISVPINMFLPTLASRIRTVHKVLQIPECATSHEVVVALECFTSREPPDIGVGEDFGAVLVHAAEAV